MPIVRWTSLFILLPVEVLVLTLRFDTETIENNTSILTWFVRQSPILLQLLLSVLTASVLIAAVPVFRFLRNNVDLKEKPQGMFGYFSVHLICFIFLYWISLKLFSGNTGVQISFIWPLAWIAAVLGVACTWGRMLFPLRVYLLIVSKYWKLLLASFVLGLFGWGVGAYTKHFFHYLGYATFRCSSQLLGLVTRDTILDWNTHELGTENFSVIIDKACSGYEGIGLILIFLTAYLWLFRKSLRFPRAFLLLPLGVLAAWLMNCFRICALILVGTFISGDIALGGFHSVAGALLFCCVALGLAWTAHHSRWLNRYNRPKSSDRNTALTVAYLAPFMSILAMTLITGLATSGFDYFYPIRILIAAIILWHYRKYYESMRVKVSWIAPAAGFVVFLFWVTLAQTPTGDSSIDFANNLKALHPFPAALWLLSRIIGSSTIVPIVEEIAFRGYLTRRIISADFSEIPTGQFSWLSFILSSVIFGLMHQRWFVGILAGFFYALVLYRRRNLADAIISHSTTNFVLSIYILFTQKWHFWL